MKPNTSRKLIKQFKKNKSNKKKKNTSHKLTKKISHKEWISSTEAAKKSFLHTDSILAAKKAMFQQKLHNLYSLFGNSST